MKNLTIKMAATSVIFAAMAFTSPVKVADDFKVDTEQSKVTWTGRKVTGEHTGNINVSSGTITWDGATIKKGTIEMDMTSITCTDLTDKEYNAKLVGHLKSDDFFSVDKFPKSLFVITDSKLNSKGILEVTGALTIKGITHPITFPANVTVKGDKLQGNANVKVDRTKYDIKYGSGTFFDNLGDKTINDEFELKIDLVAKK